MSPKQRVQQFVDRIPDSATLDEVLYKLELFSSIEIGSAQCDRGECMDHDEFCAELLAEGKELEKDHAIVRDLRSKIQGSGREWAFQEKVRFLIDRMDETATPRRLKFQLDMLEQKKMMSKSQLADFLGTDPRDILDEMPDGEEENQDSLVPTLAKKPERNTRLHRKERPANGKRVHRENEESRKPT